MILLLFRSRCYSGLSDDVMLSDLIYARFTEDKRVLQETGQRGQGTGTARIEPASKPVKAKQKTIRILRRVRAEEQHNYGISRVDL